MQTMTTTSGQIDRPAQLSERIAETTSLAGLFGFISRCLEQEVDAALIGMIRGELRMPLEVAGLAFNEAFQAAAVASLVEALAEEYTGLFVAPGCISPYASVFETGCMFKEPADRAVEAYRDAGWDYRNRMSGEFPDHIGTMIGFCGLLAEAEIDYLTRGEIKGADELKQKRDSFLVEQLGQWGPGWCRLAAEAARHPFYRKILMMTEQLLWSELGSIVDRRRLRELAELNRREPKRLDYDADFRKASGL